MFKFSVIVEPVPVGVALEPFLRVGEDLTPLCFMNRLTSIFTRVPHCDGNRTQQQQGRVETSITAV